jgi:phosphatidylinositol kinase/protein kinase (PI-3  family)
MGRKMNNQNNLEFKLLPEKPCSECLKKMIVNNNLILSVFCEHNLIGCYAFLKKGIFTQWHSISPILEQDFNLMLKGLIADTLNFVNQVLNEAEKNLPGGAA